MWNAPGRPPPHPVGPGYRAGRRPDPGPGAGPGPGEPPGEPAVPQPRRPPPTPVVLLAAAQILGGTVAVLAAGWIALATLGGPEYTDGIHLPPGGAELLSRAGWPVGVALAVGGFLAIGLARQLQRGRQWARVLLTVASATNLLATLYLDLTGTAPVNALLGVVLPVLCLVALNTGAARSWFRSGGY